MRKAFQTGEQDSYEVSLDMSRIDPKMGALWFHAELVPIMADEEVFRVMTIRRTLTS